MQPLASLDWGLRSGVSTPEAWLWGVISRFRPTGSTGSRYYLGFGALGFRVLDSSFRSSNFEESTPRLEAILLVLTRPQHQDP